MHDVPEKANPRGYPQCSVDDPRNQPGRKEREKKEGISQCYPVTFIFIFKSMAVVIAKEGLTKSYVGIINGDCVE